MRCAVPGAVCLQPMLPLSKQGLPPARRFTMVDPITVEVIRAAMNAAAEEMKICMLKTTYSPILNEARDFGCAIF
jgi:Hydantoinase B/oxoprolinase